MPFVAARYGEGGPAGSFDERSLGRRRRSLIIVGSRDADEHAGGTREVDEEMDEPRVEKKGYGGGGMEGGRGSWESDPIVCTHTFVNTSPAESSALALAFVIEPPLYFLSNCRL